MNYQDCETAAVCSLHDLTGPSETELRAIDAELELARSPLQEDLAELSDWVDWYGDNDQIPPTVELDQVVEALAAEHAELVAEIRSIAERRSAA